MKTFPICLGSQCIMNYIDCTNSQPGRNKLNQSQRDDAYKVCQRLVPRSRHNHLLLIFAILWNQIVMTSVLQTVYVRKTKLKDH